MAKKGKDFKKEENQNTILVILTIIIVVFLLIFAQLKAKKKELEDVQNKIRSKEELLAKLTKREKRIFRFIRALFVFAFFTLCAWWFWGKAVSLDTILNRSSGILIIISGFSFIRFGSFNDYHKWWSFAEIWVQARIYKGSPDIRAELNNDLEFKAQLEKEIDDLGMIINFKRPAHS